MLHHENASLHRDRHPGNRMEGTRIGPTWTRLTHSPRNLDYYCTRQALLYDVACLHGPDVAAVRVHIETSNCVMPSHFDAQARTETSTTLHASDGGNLVSRTPRASLMRYFPRRDMRSGYIYPKVPKHTTLRPSSHIVACTRPRLQLTDPVRPSSSSSIWHQAKLSPRRRMSSLGRLRGSKAVESPIST